MATGNVTWKKQKKERIKADVPIITNIFEIK